MPPTISWTQFLRAFKDAYEASPNSGNYGDCYDWTQHMLAPSTGVISRMAPLLVANPKLEFRFQWYTVDALYVSATQHDAIPGHVHCIIEHENGGAWHEEIWKLAHWRCPLKVLISYDYNDDRKAGKRHCWLSNAVERVQAQLQRINQLQGDDSATYLLIVGSKTNDNDPDVRWRAMRLNAANEALRDIDDILAE